ncbi:uncharacterized protein VTP21DRAFT_4313 [Calcarisporiella thermophila]|uniref:uncharacterized protein n=1 Tax=Calcarisporiella thermophila TaxID=911321 RepID=UPI0037447CE5
MYSIYLSLNIASMFSGLLMALLVFYFRRAQPEITNSVAFKLSLWIGVKCMLWHATKLLINIFEGPTEYSRSFGVRIMARSDFLFELWGALLAACIALDLQLSFIHRMKDMQRIQRYYAPVCFLIPFFMLVILVVTDPFKNESIYEERAGSNEHLWHMMTILIGVVSISLCAIYSLVVVMVVLLRVAKEFQNLKKSHDLRNVTKELQWKERQLISHVLRVLLYPMVLVITQPYYFIYAVLGFLLYTLVPNSEDYHFENIMGFFDIVSTYASASIGLLNLGVLLLNPTLHRAISAPPCPISPECYPTQSLTGSPPRTTTEKILSPIDSSFRNLTKAIKERRYMGTSSMNLL